jgi:hypothetical protein
LQEFRVPCCRECGAVGETGCGGAVEESGASDTIGAVRETEGGDVEAGDGFCVPEIDAFAIDQWYVLEIKLGKQLDLPAVKAAFSVFVSFFRTSSMSRRAIGEGGVLSPLTSPIVIIGNLFQLTK